MFMICAAIQPARLTDPSSNAMQQEILFRVWPTVNLREEQPNHPPLAIHPTLFNKALLRLYTLSSCPSIMGQRML